MVPSQPQRKRKLRPRSVALLALFVAAVMGPLIIGWMSDHKPVVSHLSHEVAEPGVGPALAPRPVVRPDTDRPAPPRPESPTGRVVLVVDRETKEAVSDASVEAYLANAHGIAAPGLAAPSVSTGADGRAALAAPEDPSLVLHVVARGYAAGRQLASPGQREIVVRLRRATSIGGRVLSVDGSPVSGIRLRAIADSDPMVSPTTLRTVGVGGASADLPMQATTEGDGSFLFSMAASGTLYTLFVDSREWIMISPPKGSRSGAVAAPTDDIEVRVDQVRYVRLRIENATTRERILVGFQRCEVMDAQRRVGASGFSNEADLAREVSGLDGDFLSPVRGTGAVRVAVSAHAHMPVTLDARALTWTEVSSGQHDVALLQPLIPVLRARNVSTLIVPRDALPPETPDGVPVLVVSLSETDGRPELPGASPMRDLPLAGQYADDGSLRFEGVPSGTRSAHVDIAGLRSRRAEVVLEPNKAAFFRFDFSAARVVVIEVRSKVGPLLDASVAIGRDGRPPVLQAPPTGAWRLVIAASDKPMSVQVWRPGYVSATTTIDPTTTSSTTCTVELVAGGEE